MPTERGTIIVALLLLATSGAVSQWAPQAGGTAQTLLGVSFTESLTGIFVGTAGTMRRTTDGGAAWTPQASGTTANLFAVGSTTPDIGTAVGTATILRTTDGGQNWTPQGVSFAGDLYDVEFADELHG